MRTTTLSGTFANKACKLREIEESLIRERRATTNGHSIDIDLLTALFSSLFSTKSISMPKGRYFGLIKEYDGGTPMECYVHPSIDFTRIPEMLQAQREFILSHVRRMAKSHTTVYPPLNKDFAPSLEGVSRANHTAARAMAIPGISEAGWTMADMIAATGVGKESERQRGAVKSDFLSIVRKIQEQHFSWPFREPVDTV